MTEKTSEQIHVCSCATCQQAPTGAIAQLHASINRVAAALDEKSRRRFVGLWAAPLGHGGVQHLARVTGLSRTTISQASGKAIPYGIYDVGRNRGYVSVGRSQDTPEFAVAAIRAWWLAVGRHAYPEQRHLLIEADCGGSNGHRSLVWKVRLQALAAEVGLQITVTHYPTGASKWNPIEHRMFKHFCNTTLTISGRGGRGLRDQRLRHDSG